MEPTPIAPIEKKENSFKEILKFIIIALVIIIPLRLYVAEPFFVNGASMDPTFINRDYLIVDRLSYKFENPARGNVIIFKFPKDTSMYFIKRVIGLPGETVVIEKGKVTIVNKENPRGITLTEPYISNAHRLEDTYKITLSDDEYFVMGDNRAQSSDSRAWGPLERKYIIGRPLLRLLPLSNVAVFPGAVKE